MAYFAPYIDATGLHLPSYDDILEYELAQFASVYGQSVYDGDNSADPQWIGIFSLMINDAFNTAQLSTNARSPVTAIGADLDTIVKVNGITRKSATYSIAVLACGGVAGTVLNGAIAQDQNGFLWTLPNATIPNSGTINLSAVCQSVGAIAALAGTINVRSTPIAGWNSVNNPADAIPGNPTESDSQLRGRQAASVSLSAKTLVASTLAGIAAVPGVTRYATIGVENPTGGVDIYGNPAHSISMVVEGGLDLDIATAIYNNKTPGCLTNGTTSTPVVDPNTQATMNIGWSRPTYIPIFVTLNIHPLGGYTSATTAAIQQAVNTYLNGLQIGESLTISGLYFAAMSVMPNPLLPQFSVQALFAGATQTGIAGYTIGASAGSGYAINDIVTVTQGGASGGQLKVTAVSGGGIPTALALIAPGHSYTVANNLATTGGTGTGLQVDITSIGSNTSTDVALNFNQVVSGSLANVIVNTV